MKFRHTIFLLIFLVSTSSVRAQSFIPLDETIKMPITARDTDLMLAYNIYSFDYTAKDGDKFSGDFLILKQHDTISHKSYILGQLTIVKEFIMVPAKDGRPPFVLPAGGGIEVGTKKGLNKQAYLNFDPTLPDPVFMLKQVEREIAQ